MENKSLKTMLLGLSVMLLGFYTELLGHRDPSGVLVGRSHYLTHLLPPTMSATIAMLSPVIIVVGLALVIAGFSSKTHKHKDQ